MKRTRRLLVAPILGAVLVASCGLGGPEDSNIVRFSQRCDTEGVEFWIGQGEDPSHVDELGSFPLEQAIVGGGAPDGAGCAETIRVLLDAGAEPQVLSQGEGLLFVAAKHAEDPDVVRLLVEAGVDPCREPGDEWRSSYGSSDLARIALRSGRPDVVIDAIEALEAC